MSSDRPVQFVFAGKSHPADDSGKELIRQVSAFAADPDVRHRFVFVDDYDIAVARALLQGADVWLNNPRRPQEACGTSGMKAALNGGLNLSILDGWWDECFDGENGWAISSAEQLDDLERRDEVEAGSLFELLERQVVPLFYDRSHGPVPRGWVRRVKRSLVTLGPFVTAARMVRDYVEQLYEPTAAQGDRLGDGDHAPARSLSAWKAKVGERGAVSTSTASTSTRRWSSSAPTAPSRPWSPSAASPPSDVEVQLLHGPAGQGGELLDPVSVPMTDAGPADDGHLATRGRFVCEQAGRYGVTVRVVPNHEALVTPAELGRIAWA